MSVWLKAAEIVDNPNPRIGRGEFGRGCCTAIAVALDPTACDGESMDRTTASAQTFAQWFGPKMGDPDWAGAYFWGNPDYRNPHNRTARIIALCLMDCLEKDGQL